MKQQREVAWKMKAEMSAIVGYSDKIGQPSYWRFKLYKIWNINLPIKLMLPYRLCRYVVFFKS